MIEEEEEEGEKKAEVGENRRKHRKKRRWRRDGRGLQVLHWILLAAVTNHRDFGGLNRGNVFCYRHGGGQPEMSLTELKSWCQQGSSRQSVAVIF